MSDRDEQSEVEPLVPGPQPIRLRWSPLRWLLVTPAFLAGWYITNWAPIIGTRADYSEDRLIWVGYTLAGFLPVYVAAKVAPERQLPVAIVCALVVAAHVAFFLAVVFFTRDSPTSSAVLAYILGFRLLTLTGAASAAWLVMKTRNEGTDDGWIWVGVTVIVLPVASFVFVAFQPKIQ